MNDKMKKLEDSLNELNNELNNKSLYLDKSELKSSNKLYIVYDDEVLMTDNLTLILNIGFFDFYSNESQANLLKLLKIINEFIS